MQHFEQMNRTTDALRFAVQDLSEAIERARRKHRKGEMITGRNYLRQIRDVYELQVKADALGATGPLVEPLMPDVFNSQLVGRTAEERKALEWKGVFARFPFPIPHHFKIAAE
ncbi:hypothetical protein [Rhizobium sp. LCM 4573]|uniref:hypothetical protein n=1 Tax=Rhizobium sp. LCM 4573 TaxID=1848291 RepID=UPI0008DAB320|nr:hypothetical protein [Rhizobium sp. LCM 4573]OHV81649.1 hypothetical protein LCM4573_21450 [Rhizobium sp. LCM 4573]